MEIEDKNKIILEHIYEVAKLVNAEYNGLIDENKIIDMYIYYKDTEKDYELEIVPEIDKKVEEIIAENLKMQKELEDIMKLKQQKEEERLMKEGLGNEFGTWLLCTQTLNYLTIEQLNSKEAIKEYISNVYSQFSGIDSKNIMDSFDSIVTDRQIESIKDTLNKNYENSLMQKYSNIKIGTPEEARAKLMQAGIEKEDIDKVIKGIAKGETIDIIKELESKYGKEVIENINNGVEVKQEENVEQLEESEYRKYAGEDVRLNNGQVYTKVNAKTLVKKYPTNGGFGFTMMLALLVAFGAGIISTITYLIISSIFIK